MGRVIYKVIQLESKLEKLEKRIEHLERILKGELYG